jgi:multiple sugar transport system permease protein
VAVCTSAGAIAIGLPAAYSFVRFRYHGRETLSLAVLCVHVMPPIAMIIPLYVIYSRLGLLDSRLGLAVTHISLTLPLSVWLLRGFVLRVPVELEEAAQVDGCGRLQALWRVVIPIMAPGIAATAVLTFLYSWNDFIYAVILTGRGARTLPVMISGFITERAVYWDRVAAAGMLVLLPTAILGAVVQRYLAAGLAAGAVKG